MSPTPINRVAIDLGFLEVYWYGLIIGTGIVLALLLVIWRGKQLGISSDTFLDLVMFAVPAAIIGARLYYVAFKWDYYVAHLGEIIAIWEGGLAIHGALIAAILTGYIFCRKRKLSFWQMADIAAPAIILGQLIGRWGNFINQEAHGGEVTRAYLEGLHLPQFIIDQMYINGAYYHPTFLYESIWNLIGLLLLLGLQQLNARRGEVFLNYFIWYSIGRFFIEGIRTDSLAFTGPEWLAGFMRILWAPANLLFEPGSMDYGNVRIAQFIGVVLILLSIGVLIYRRVKGYSNERFFDNLHLPERKEPDDHETNMV
ncbi:MAG: prolipoprotein diacylglyceryl transferase [Bacilli bacterium]